MLNPPQRLNARRAWLTCGHYYYACHPDWVKIQPAGFSVPNCLGTLTSHLTMKDDGHITALTASNVTGCAIGETLHFRVQYTNNGIAAISDELLISGTGATSNWVRWPMGVYPFKAGDILIVEHKSTTTGSYYAEFLVSLVEVAFV